MRIDMQRDRELLGLPQKNKYKLPRFIKIVLGGLIVLLVSSGVGRLIGMQSNLLKQVQISSDYQLLVESSNPDEVLPLLRAMRNRALQGSSEERLLYSFACIHASSIMPRQRVWLEEGLLQLNVAINSGIKVQELFDAAIMQRASVLLELGKDREALAEIKRLNTEMSLKQILNTDPNSVEGGANFYNIYAYILASSKDSEVRNGELALKLIKRIIVLPKGRNSAYLDTLAEAYFSVGKVKEAINAERFALARSDQSNLWYLTQNFKKYTSQDKKK